MSIIPCSTSSLWSSIGPLWALILARSRHIWRRCKRPSVPRRPWPQPGAHWGRILAEHFGFILFVPIYKSGMPHGTFEERRASLQGFTVAIFHLGTLVAKALQGMGLGTMGLELSDVTDAASQYLLSLQLYASHSASWTFLRVRARRQRPFGQGHTGRRHSTSLAVNGLCSSTPHQKRGHPCLASLEHPRGGAAFDLLCAGFFLLKWRL